VEYRLSDPGGEKDQRCHGTDRIGERPNALRPRSGQKEGKTMKKKLGGGNLLYPTPTTVAGTIVNGRPNFITIAHIGIMNHATPHLVSLSLARKHHSNQGIRENGTFSVNIPSEDLVVETDCAGLFSGKKYDKSGLFKIFYGELKTAPMIEQCPVCMECNLHDVYEAPTHENFIGAIVETYVEESVLTDGVLDLAKVKPLLFDMNTRQYWSLGTPIAKCWEVGKQLKSSLGEES
jgi:flavin reductase (DIM6/NTAB) family NADH-FMN oxidoreductase RutF